MLCFICAARGELLRSVLWMRCVPLPGDSLPSGGGAVGMRPTAGGLQLGRGCVTSPVEAWGGSSAVLPMLAALGLVPSKP